MKPRDLQFAALSVFVIIILIGCSESTPPPLRLGTNRWPGYEPLYLARELSCLNTNQVHWLSIPLQQKPCQEALDYLFQ